MQASAHFTVTHCTPFFKTQNAFKEEIIVKQENMERLQLALRQQIPTKAQKQTSTLGTVHEVMQGETITRSSS